MILQPLLAPEKDDRNQLPFHGMKSHNLLMHFRPVQVLLMEEIRPHMSYEKKRALLSIILVG